MEGNNIFMGIPIAALCCFLFLMFSFFNARRSKAVYIFQIVVMLCMVWTGGDVLMRLEVIPSSNFWMNVSFLGLLLLPVGMYAFLFCMLDIKKTQLLKGVAMLACAIVFVNGVSGFMLSVPEKVVRTDGSVAYTYHVGDSVIVLLIAEFVLLIYVTVLAHFKINGDLTVRRKLSPLLLGTIFVMVGNILSIQPDNVFPYNALGGLLMAGCMLYVIYKQYAFDWGNRVKIGAIYMMAMAVVFLPIYFIIRGSNGEPLQMSKSDQEFVIIAVLLMAWGLAVFWVAAKMASYLVECSRQEKLEQIRNFQNDTASLFSEEELYDKILETIEGLKLDVMAYIFVKKENERKYRLVRKGNDTRELSEEQISKIIAVVNSSRIAEHTEVALLKYDGIIHGFIYLQAENNLKMSYIEEECYRQIGTYASVCLKNISIYQKVYQISIHDELTGLYNRAYFNEFIEKYWNTEKKQTMICMDLDDFKLFNELYGEKCGDDILRWCGKKLLQVIGVRGTTFRLGANEFWIFTRCIDKKELLAMLEEIRNAFAMSDFDKPKVIQPITMSVGIACSTESSVNADEQVRQAQKALFFAKRSGKNRVEVYEAGVDDTEETSRDETSYEQIAPTIYALTAAIDAKDAYTFQHSCNVSSYAVLLAKEIGLNNNEVQMVKEAGLLHDIGKIGVPESILKKQGSLTPEEFEIMKSHVVNSIEMIHHLPNMDYVIPAVLSHHERYDGRGYPRGLAGQEIPLLGRILAVCDSYDAITTKRSYKEALSKEYAMAELERNKGAQFDPMLAEAFIKMIQEERVEIGKV